MFIAFDLMTVALALLGFYTYPVIVAVVNVALGRETLDRPRIVALALAVAGMVAVVASQLDPATGHPARCDRHRPRPAPPRSARRSSWSSAGTATRRCRPSQAMAVVLATTVVCAWPSRCADRRRGTRWPSRCASRRSCRCFVFTGLFAAAIPSILFLTGIRPDRRDPGRAS